MNLIIHLFRLLSPLWHRAAMPLICALFVAVHVGPALAQPSESPGDSGDIVVYAEKLPAPDSDATLSIVEVPLQSASNRLEDALRGVAGLTQFRRTDARSANATSQGATLRGLGGNASSRALLVLDGVPQSDPFGGWISWPAYAPERLASVRVTRGGGSAVHGSGALAGVIELESIAGGAGAQGSLAYGSRNSLEASALIKARLGSGTGFLSANFARGDGFIPIAEGRRGTADIASPYRQASLAARGVVDVNSHTQLQASMTAFTDRRNRGTILSGNGGDGADASVRIVDSGYNSSWPWEFLVYAQVRKFQSRFVAIDAARATVTQTVDQYNVPSTGLGAKGEVRIPIGELATLRLGGDWRRTVGETKEFFTYVSGLPTRLREAGGKADVLGGFAEASLLTGDFTLSASGRVDHWSLTNGRLVERTLSTGVSIRNEIAPDPSGWELTGRVGAAWEAGDFKLRTAGYLGWRLPTLNELYRPFRVGADATAANAALAPERMRGAEIGANWTFSRTSLGLRDIPETSISEDAASVPNTLSVTLFSNRLVDPIANVTLGAGAGTFPGVGFVAAGGAYRQRLNVDAVRSNGVEVDLNWRKGDWRAQASYALTDARMRTSGLAAALSGLRPAQVPTHTASASIGWKGLSATARYVSAQFEDDLNTRRLADALTFDAVARVPLGKRLSVEVRGENLANARVEAAVSATGVIERATPRTLWVGVVVR